MSSTFDPVKMSERQGALIPIRDLIEFGERLANPRIERAVYIAKLLS